TATIKRRTLELSVPRSRWKEAPEFRKRDLSQLTDPAVAAQIQLFYTKFSEGDKSARSMGSVKPNSPNPPPKAAQTDKQRREAKLQLATDLVGKEVIDRQGEKLGEVSDLLIDLADAKPVLAVILTQGLFKRESTFVAPIRSMNLGQKGKIFINADRNMFQR